MKTKLLKVQHLAFLLLCALCSIQAKADYTCWTQANYKMAIKGTTEPNYECGKIYVSTVLVTDESQIEAVAEEITTDPLYHYGPASACKQDYYFYAKANDGYKLAGWGTAQPSDAKWTPGSAYVVNEANKIGDYYWYKGTTGSPYSDNTEAKPTKLTRYAVFEKVEKIEEPTGTTPVEVTAVTGTTELVEGSIAKNFSVDIVLSENLPYEMPGSDKNAKPNESLKQFVTVKGANGNTSEVASYSLVSESNAETSYSCHTFRLSFPYNIKADTYTVHLPYGLYTTVNGNPTPTYEFTINVTADDNPYLTIKSQFPTEGTTIKYVKATQTKEPDSSKGEFEKSNITVAIEFNEVVESIDESKKDGISLTNTTVGVNYKPSNVIRNAAMFGKVSGAVSIAYPELVNGPYTLTIPAGLFVSSSKANEEIKVNFTVSGFSTTLKPYEMTTEQISPKANDMLQKIEKLQDITISYKGEFGQAVALVGDASGISVRRYTEVIVDGEDSKGNETHEPVRTYYDVTTTPSAKVEGGKLVVSFTPALFGGMYEVTVPAGLAANMEPGEMTMIQKVNAGYAETPAYNMTFNVKEDDATAINSINPEFINAEAIYNVNGVRMNTLQKGLNIIKTANGTKKVVIK
ncbi:MAG: hypothetical protein MJZ32_05235 [Bacteroidaceae bacterium]|nr:hypothetical protein [Bacteroidaceae bacterium]